MVDRAHTSLVAWVHPGGPAGQRGRLKAAARHCPRAGVATCWAIILARHANCPGAVRVSIRFSSLLGRAGSRDGAAC